MTYKVLVTCKQMQESLDELLAENPMPDFSFTSPELTKQGFTSSEMVELMKNHHAAIVGDDVVDKLVFSVPGLKFVCKWGAGVDGIDFEAAASNGVVVENTPGIFGDDVADLAIGYLISLTRKIHQVDKSVRAGGWPRIKGVSLSGMRVLVYGVGNIGTEIVFRLKASKCEIVLCDPRPDLDFTARSLGVSYEGDLHEAATGVDAIIVSCPLTPETRFSLDKEIFELMNWSGFIVNISRGQIIVETDLISALNSGRILGAALDVFEKEPLPMNSEFLQMESAILGSHNASNTDLAVIKASEMALRLLSEFFQQN